jgi:hypothetical protein
VEIVPRKSIGVTAMTDAERQARYRAARAAGAAVVRTRRPADHRGRARRWNDNVAALVEAQAEYAAWLDSLPDSLQDSATAEALRAICELDLSELQAIVPPIDPRNVPNNCSSPTRARPGCATPTSSAAASAAVRVLHKQGSILDADPGSLFDAD